MESPQSLGPEARAAPQRPGWAVSRGPALPRGTSKLGHSPADGAAPMPDGPLTQLSLGLQMAAGPEPGEARYSVPTCGLE